MSMPIKKRPPYADPVREMRERCKELSAATALRRNAQFNATFSGVGAILSTMRGGDLASAHPDRCKCQDRSGERDPHKHYPEPPHSCARGCGCRAYTAAVPEDAPP